MLKATGHYSHAVSHPVTGSPIVPVLAQASDLVHRLETNSALSTADIEEACRPRPCLVTSRIVVRVIHRRRFDSAVCDGSSNRCCIAVQWRCGHNLLFTAVLCVGRGHLPALFLCNIINLSTISLTRKSPTLSLKSKAVMAIQKTAAAYTYFGIQ